MDLRSHSVSRRGCKMWKASVIAAFLLSWFRLGSGVEVCPSESFNLTCTVSDTSGGFGSTIWRGDSSVFDCASGDLTLSHGVSMATGDCGPLAEGRIVAADGNNFTSVLTVTAPMNGSLLPAQCTFPQPLGMPAVVVMEYNVNVTGPPGFVPDNLNVGDIMPVGEDQWEFCLTWKVPPEHCVMDYTYVFTPLPPIAVCTTTCTTGCRRFRVGPGPHTFTVTAQNCGGTQNGTESEPLPVCFQRPGAPENVSATATYDLDRSGVLSSLVLSWDEVIPKPVTAARQVPILNYTISGVGAGSIQVAPNGSCSNGRCSYEVDVPDDGTSTEDSVSVAAMNELGVGNATTVEPVFSSNMYANVTPKSEDGNCTLIIECLIEDVNEFWITVNHSGTTVPTRRSIDCDASAAMMVDELSMLPEEFEYEIEMMIDDIMVILLGTIKGCTTPTLPPVVTTASSSGGGGSSAGAIAGGAGGGGGVAFVYGTGVVFNGVMAACKRASITHHPCAIILLCLLSWFYGFYLLCPRACLCACLCAWCYATSKNKPSQEKSVEAAVDDKAKESEEVIDMSDAYETVPSTQPAVKTKVMGVESTQPQQGAAKSEEEPKAAKKKGFFKNRSGKKADKKKSDEVELQPQEPLEPAETGAETGALYQDPGEIKREEYPGTHDFYAQPDIKRKTHKPEDHLPTYGDPRDIKHVEAPETGELYAVTKQPSKKRAAPPPPEGATGYTSVDIEKKHRAKELNYSELQMPPGGPAPPSQHVEYSNVVQL